MATVRDARAVRHPRRLVPVNTDSTAVIVADRVREAIARGDLAPGMQLGEVELAQQLGVSRGPFREGVQRLAQEGLLVSIRNRGVFVVELTPERVEDVCVAREAVERAAAEQIHRRDAAEAGRRLLQVAEDTDTTPREDVAGVCRAGIAFHELLVHLAGSPWLERMHRTLIIETRMCISALDPTDGDIEVRTQMRIQERMQEHRAIAQSFIDGDPAATERRLRRHMHAAAERLTAAARGDEPS